VICRGKFDSVTNEINNSLKWLSCKFGLRFEILKLAFNMIHGSCPDYFNGYLCTNNGSSSIQHELIRSSWGERSFRYSASKLWFELPHELQTCDSYVRFKSLLFNFLIGTQQSEFNSHDDDNCCDLSCIGSVLEFHCDDNL
jgi:hypothetical protein